MDLQNLHLNHLTDEWFVLYNLVRVLKVLWSLKLKDDFSMEMRMVEKDGERYCNATEAAVLIDIPRHLFYANVRQHLEAYKVGARRRRMYKVSDLEPFRSVQPIAVEV
jgi:hypothetical protein